jgi:hypothetical protein
MKTSNKYANLLGDIAADGALCTKTKNTQQRDPAI